jgi:hypothetical protein
MTSTNAFFMSVPRANRRLRLAPSANALPSISSTPPSPCITFSSGSSSSDSTSSGEAVRQPIWIESCGRLTSGKSCSGSRLRLSMPTRPTKSATTMIATGLRLDQLRLSMASLKRDYGGTLPRNFGC